MTDFQKWYAKTSPDLDPYLDDISDELRMAYEAGAASQAGTLRDKFAGRAMAAALREEDWMQMHDAANFAYEMADEMLKARKAPKGGK
jgi:hypothetical protein